MRAAPAVRRILLPRHQRGAGNDQVAGGRVSAAIAFQSFFSFIDYEIMISVSLFLRTLWGVMCGYEGDVPKVLCSDSEEEEEDEQEEEDLVAPRAGGVIDLITGSECEGVLKVILLKVIPDGQLLHQHGTSYADDPALLFFLASSLQRRRRRRGRPEDHGAQAPQVQQPTPPVSAPGLRVPGGRRVLLEHQLRTLVRRRSTGAGPGRQGATGRAAQGSTEDLVSMRGEML